MKEIRLEQLLPNVFADLGESAAIAGSEVWLESLAFSKPERYLVFAESGTGKSSLCSFIYGARTDFDGRILFDGEDCSTYSPERWSQIRRDSLAYLPQQLSLFPELTVMENIMIKNRLTDYCSESEIRDMLRRLGVEEKADVATRLLSIGQQQRVATVRALCQPFDFLLLDEPVSHLDERNNTIVAEMVIEAVASRGAGLIVTSVGNHLAAEGFKTLKL